MELSKPEFGGSLALLTLRGFVRKDGDDRALFIENHTPRIITCSVYDETESHKGRRLTTLDVPPNQAHVEVPLRRNVCTVLICADSEAINGHAPGFSVEVRPKPVRSVGRFKLQSAEAN